MTMESATSDEREHPSLLWQRAGLARAGRDLHANKGKRPCRCLTLPPVGANWRRLPVGIWALGFVSLQIDISSEMIHALLPVYLVVGLRTTTPIVGVIEGIAEATASITKVFSGALSDRIGRCKELAAIGYGLAALALAPRRGVRKDQRCLPLPVAGRRLRRRSPGSPCNQVSGSKSRTEIPTESHEAAWSPASMRHGQTQVRRR
jgi:hypothetical protein